MWKSRGAGDRASFLLPTRVILDDSGGASVSFAPTEDLPPLQYRFNDEERHGPAEPTGGGKLFVLRADAGRVQRAPQCAEGDERERHHVTANHPLPMLLDEASENRRNGQRGRHQPRDAEPRDAESKHPTK